METRQCCLLSTLLSSSIFRLLNSRSVELIVTVPCTESGTRACSTSDIMGSGCALQRHGKLETLSDHGLCTRGFSAKPLSSTVVPSSDGRKKKKEKQKGGAKRTIHHLCHSVSKLTICHFIFAFRLLRSRQLTTVKGCMRAQCSRVRRMRTVWVRLQYVSSPALLHAAHTGQERKGRPIERSCGEPKVLSPEGETEAAT